MISLIKKFGIILNKRQKRNIFILFIITLIGTFLEILGVSLMLPMITAIMNPDIIHTNETIAWLCSIFDLHSHRTFVIVCIAALILVFVVKNLFLIFESYAQTRFVCNNRLYTQERLVHAFMKKPYEYYLNASTGEIMRIISGDASQVFSLLSTLLFVASESIVSIALIITIFVIDPAMTTFVAVMMLILILVIVKIIRPIIRKAGLEYQKSSAETNKWLIQSINGIKEIKVAKKEAFFEENYRIAGNRTIHSEKINTVSGSVPRLLIEMISMCAMLALIAAEIYFGREIETLVPTLGAFAMAAVKLMPAANRIVGAVNSITYSLPALDKLIENLQDLEAPYSGSSEIEITKDKSVDLKLDEYIELKHITYHYPNSQKNVLDDSSMIIPVGKSVGIVGTSGAGKTTAVDIMLGLLKPQKGAVLVDGVDVMNDYEEWLSHIGYIPQMIFMLDESIRANVAFGVAPKEVDEERLWISLEEAQLADFIRSLPEGADTKIGERGVRLSGGQRQRIGIARALYNNPDLLLFDEATSALDNETEAAIMESINSLHGKKTMVIIAHRLQTIEGCDIVYRVKEGQIVKERG